MAENDADLAAMLTRTLSPFEGRDVTGCAVEIRKVGGGLNPAVAFDPVEFHYGEKVYVMLEAEVGPVRFDPVVAKGGDDTGTSRRVHILNVTTGGATFVEPKLGKELIAAQREKVELFREEARGVQRLRFGDGDSEDDGDAAAKAEGAAKDGRRPNLARKTAAKKAAATRRSRARSPK